MLPRCGAPGRGTHRLPARSCRGKEVSPWSAALEYPFVIFQEIDRAHDPLLDRQLRLPAEPPDARAIEKDERAVADPPALASCISKLRRDAQAPCDPPDRIFHLAILVRSEVENVHLLSGLLHRRQNRGNAVPNVQVRLPLAAIAENIQIIRVSFQLPVKIEDMPVRVALPQNGDEAEDVRL